MNANQAKVPVHRMCRVLNVSASGYYAWLDRAPSKRSIQDAVLVERIRAIHAESDATYGMPRVRAELVDEGVKISAKRVARLMRLNAIRGVSRRRGFVVTTQRDQRQRPAPDLVKREFVADGPNQLWVADMTYVPTWAGFIYLAIVLDVWSRRVVGWAIGEQMTAELVLAALNMALQQRRPDGVVHHSDQGSQYTSIAFGERCKKMGVRPSMGTVGDAYDNAMAESFFASLECELIDRRSERRVPSAKAFLSRLADTARVSKPLSEVLSHGRLHEVADALAPLDADDFVRLPPGQRALILLKCDDVVTSGSESLRPAAISLLETLLRIALLIPKDEFREIVRPAIDWAYEKNSFGRQGNWALQEALVAAASAARVEAHGVLSGELLAFLADKKLVDRQNWYLQVLRNFLNALLANQSCQENVAELSAVMRDLNRTQRSRG